MRHGANVLGSLDGLPALVRVEANRYRVPELLRAAEQELAGLENSDDEDDLSRAEMIRKAGMRSDPSLGGVEQIGIGHSWGVANLTSSEVAGSEYDKVISLAGAGMLPDWRPNDDTTYTDLSYRDILLHFQSKGLVWDGNNPRSNGAFEHGPLYVGPDDAELDGRFVDGEEWGILTENHNLIASNNDDNKRALEDLRTLVAQ